MCRLSGQFCRAAECGIRRIEESKDDAGDNVVIVGGGPIGMYFVKLCKQMGAGKVLVTGRSPSRRKYLE